jgi:hypothetical protein
MLRARKDGRHAEPAAFGGRIDWLHSMFPYRVHRPERMMTSNEAKTDEEPRPSPNDRPRRSPPHSGEGAASAMNELRKRRAPEQPAPGKLRKSPR